MKGTFGLPFTILQKKPHYYLQTENNFPLKQAFFASCIIQKSLLKLLLEQHQD